MVHFGHVNVVRLLLSYGINVDVQDKVGKSAIELAQDYGHEEIVKVLAEHTGSGRW